MMGFMLVAYILMSVMLNAVVGKGRFYLQHTHSGREFRHSRYGVWLEKLFAGLSTAGLLPILLIVFGAGLAQLTGDRTEKPYVFSICLIPPLALTYYQLLLTVAHRCENDYRYLKIQQVTVPCQKQRGKIIVDVNDILLAFEQARKTMSHHVVLESGAGVDIIDPTLSAEMKRDKRYAGPYTQLTVEECSRHEGWGVVRQSNHRRIIGNLALDTKLAELQVKAALPIINLRPTSEEMLEFQLASLSKEDRRLIERLFLEAPVLRQLALHPSFTIRLGIVSATEDTPRHVRIRGIVLRGRVKS